MNKYLKYINHDLSNDFKKFQLMYVGLKKEKTESDCIIEKIDKRLSLNIKELNIKLKKYYKGSWKFGPILDEKCKKINDIKINKEDKRKIFELYLLNNKFSDIKKELEKKLKKELKIIK